MNKEQEGIAICKAGGGRKVVALTLYSNGVIRCGSFKGCPLSSDPSCEISKFREEVKEVIEAKRRAAQVAHTASVAMRLFVDTLKRQSR